MKFKLVFLTLMIYVGIGCTSKNKQNNSRLFSIPNLDSFSIDRFEQLDTNYIKAKILQNNDLIGWNWKAVASADTLADYNREKKFYSNHVLNYYNFYKLNIPGCSDRAFILKRIKKSVPHFGTLQENTQEISLYLVRFKDNKIVLAIVVAEKIRIFTITELKIFSIPRWTADNILSVYETIEGCSDMVDEEGMACFKDSITTRWKVDCSSELMISRDSVRVNY